MGGESTPSRAVVQSAIRAFRVTRQIVKEEFNRSVEFRVLLLRYMQALIANMLGVRREGVTEAAGKLQKSGIIRSNRGTDRLLPTVAMGAQTN